MEPQIATVTASRARVRRFSQLFSCKEAWFGAADDLIAAMKLLEPQIEEYWHKASAQIDEPKNEQSPPLGLISIHMMLAGFATENLCKGL